jgi:hypothetical protein
MPKEPLGFSMSKEPLGFSMIHGDQVQRLTMCFQASLVHIPYKALHFEIENPRQCNILPFREEPYRTFLFYLQKALMSHWLLI